MFKEYIIKMFPAWVYIRIKTICQMVYNEWRPLYRQGNKNGGVVKSPIYISTVISHTFYEGIKIISTLLS